VASYLLKASDSDMKRWKEEAARCRVPFAEWLRRAADAAALDIALSTSREPVVHAPPVVLGGKRSYESDPKGGRR
jgi:hypothetical protein